MLDDTVITLRVHGLDVQDVLKRLGGLGRDKPVHAITIGEDLFAQVEAIREMATDALDTFSDKIAAQAVLDIIEGRPTGPAGE